VSNLKRRLERLEGLRPMRSLIICLEPGETPEEAWKKHLAKHPEDEKVENKLFYRGRTPEERLLQAKAPPSFPIKERPGR